MGCDGIPRPKDLVANAPNRRVPGSGPVNQARQGTQARQDLAALVDTIYVEAFLVRIAQSGRDAVEPRHRRRIERIHLLYMPDGIEG